jgi:ParB-like chromosome segregation protein Spo0J
MRTTRGFTARPISDKLVASIRKWGWTIPAAVDENGVMIAGHGRVAAGAKLKLTHIPVIVARVERRGEAGLSLGRQ